MKIINWSLYPKREMKDFFKFLFLSPLLSYRIHHQQSKSRISFGLVVTKLLISLSFSIFILGIGKYVFYPLNYFEIILLSPIIYFLTESLGSFAQLLFLPFTKVIQIHQNPLGSQSLADFWGRRWNRWVQDWLRDLSRPFKKSLLKKLVMTFCISGLFHEAMMSFPAYYYLHQFFFGQLTLYFGIQGIGLWVEKKWVSRSSKVFQLIYTWVVILAPSPLFVNQSLLYFLGLINE